MHLAQKHNVHDCEDIRENGVINRHRHFWDNDSCWGRGKRCWDMGGGDREWSSPHHSHAQLLPSQLGTQLCPLVLFCLGDGISQKLQEVTCPSSVGTFTVLDFPAQLGKVGQQKSNLTTLAASIRDLCIFHHGFHSTSHDQISLGISGVDTINFSWKLLIHFKKTKAF